MSKKQKRRKRRKRSSNSLSKNIKIYGGIILVSSIIALLVVVLTGNAGRLFGNAKSSLAQGAAQNILGNKGMTANELKSLADQYLSGRK